MGCNSTSQREIKQQFDSEKWGGGIHQRRMVSNPMSSVTLARCEQVA